MSRRIMAPDEIERQRAVGWPEIHPEDFCHRCGMENMLWAAEREEWLKATKAWAAETGREGICCPQCFADLHREATGASTVWILLDSKWFQALTEAVEAALSLADRMDVTIDHGNGVTENLGATLRSTVERRLGGAV